MDLILKISHPVYVKNPKSETFLVSNILHKVYSTCIEWKGHAKEEIVDSRVLGNSKCMKQIRKMEEFSGNRLLWVRVFWVKLRVVRLVISLGARETGKKASGALLLIWMLYLRSGYFPVCTYHFKYTKRMLF